ncbi:expressed protein [Phakopsora pachyrhizi]|uniref:Expressed protein n=1 Tax=Phakopsora pachyrhizi TaxID=170000 RepID=A0AAV0BT95_PHAPC|nr:expressed protein [Phakopsora pachyrhizi]
MLATHAQQAQAQQQHLVTSASNSPGPTKPTNPNLSATHASSSSSGSISNQTFLSNNGSRALSQPHPVAGFQPCLISNQAHPGNAPGIPSFNFMPPGLLLPSFHPVMIPNLYAINSVGPPQSPLSNHPQHRSADHNKVSQSLNSFQTMAANLPSSRPSPGSYSLPPIRSSAQSDSLLPGSNPSSASQSPSLVPYNPSIHHSNHQSYFLHYPAHPQPQHSHPQLAPLVTPYTSSRAHSAPPANASSCVAPSLSIAALSLQPLSPIQMFSSHHESREPDSLSGSLPPPEATALSGKRSASLSGQAPLPSPRPRTHSSQSDRPRPGSNYVARPQSLAGASQHANFSNGSNLNFSSLRPRADSQNSRQSTSSSPGVSNGPSSATVKPSNSGVDSYQLANLSRPHSRSPTPSTTASPKPTSNLSHSPSPSLSSGHSSVPPSHHIPSNTVSHSGNMVRRPSPLSQTSNSSASSSDSRPASYRFSHASTITPSSSTPPKGIPPASSQIPSQITTQSENRDCNDDDDDDAAVSSGTASDADHRLPGHRSTPATSVDSTNSNSAQGNYRVPRLVSLPESDPDFSLHKHSKLNLSNKLRRALHLAPLPGAISNGTNMDSVAPKVDQKLKSSSASVAGVKATSRPIGPNSLAPQPGTQSVSGRRFGFLNPKANSSTDNLSISSTVSSASVMIRKLGNLGKSARRSSMMGLTKIFKEKNGGNFAEGKTGEEGLQNSQKPSSHALKNIASTSVAQVTAEVDRSISSQGLGLTPAAAFIHQQKQQFAEQERAAAAAAELGSNSADKVSAGSNSGSVSSANEARKKMIEKEKERLKIKKTRKWGFGASSNATSSDLNPLSGVTPPAVDEVQSLELVVEGDDDEEWDDRTVRGSTVEASINSMISGGLDPVEELGRSENDDNLSEYDAESLFGSASNEKAARQQRLRVRPPKEALPKKGILKNAQNFSQNEFLPNPPVQSYNSDSTLNLKGSSNAHSLKNTRQVEDLGTSGLVIDLGEAPDLRLQPNTFKSAKRATFAQNLSVHSTWPPAIYDRRGEPATCNRLTPTLAQKIKEELNAYKMEEMEVHYASRTHTHFFVVSSMFILAR